MGIYLTEESKARVRNNLIREEKVIYGLKKDICVKLDDRLIGEKDKESFVGKEFELEVIKRGLSRKFQVYEVVLPSELEKYYTKMFDPLMMVAGFVDMEDRDVEWMNFKRIETFKVCGYIGYEKEDGNVELIGGEKYGAV